MAEFTFDITREYTITESFRRTITADTLEAAQVLAEVFAFEANNDCPDDLSEDESGFSESTSFEAKLVPTSPTKE
jgi:hypothetical protein